MIKVFSFLSLLFALEGRADTPPPANTDHLREGVVNLYSTSPRIDARITLQKGSLNGLATLDGSGKIPVGQLPSGTGTVTSVSASGPLHVSNPTTTPALTIDQADATHDGYLSLGNFNLFNGKEPAISSGTSSQYWRGDKTFQTLNTLAVPELTNLYYTQARFDSAFSAKSTTDLAEGTNLYFTNARVDTEFDTRLATKSTTNLTEGSNLYYTDARARAALSATAPITYNSSTGVIGFTPVPPAQHWYVDNTRTDTYAADGSRQWPYKTIMGAVNAIIAAGLNSPTHVDEVDIDSPSIYVENVTFNNAALKAIILDGHGWADIVPASGTAIDSSATNTQLGLLVINGFLSISSVNFVGDVNGTSFGAVSSGGITLQNSFVSGTLNAADVGELIVTNTQVNGTIGFQNIISGQFTGMVAPSTLTVTHDNAQNKPSGLGTSGTSLIVQGGTNGPPTVSAGATLQYRNGARIGTTGNTCTISGNLVDYAAVYRCNMVIASGGVWTPSMSAYNGTLSNSGTITPSGQIQANAFVGDSGSGGNRGLVPAPAAGDAAALKYLGAGGTFSVPGSNGVTNQSGVTGTTASDALNTLNTNTADILLSAIKNGGGVTANTEIPTWTTVSKDTNSAFNASTGTFTVPVAGDYSVDFHADTTALTPTAQIYHNGVLVQTGINSVTRTWVGTVIPNCAINDTIWVALDTTATLTSTATDTILNISKVTGSPTGVVNARYHSATGTITSSLSNISWTTKDIDSNNALSGATFTVPSAGVYAYQACIYLTATTVAANQVATCAALNNASIISEHTVFASSASTKPLQCCVGEPAYKFAASDALTFQASLNGTTNSISASTVFNTLSITKISN